MSELRKNKKGQKGAPVPLSPLESTALRLYHSGKISIEDYSTMVECKPVRTTKSKDSFDLPEHCFPPPPPEPDPVDDDKVAPDELDAYIDGGPPPAPEPPEESDWTMPSPPPEDVADEEHTAVTVQVVQEKGEDANEKCGNEVDKCYLWCFRCPLRLGTHEILFGDRKIPDWLKLENGKDRPPFIPICCGQCNREKRHECDNREEEEDYVRKGFLYLKFDWDALSKEPRKMAAIRAGQAVTLFTRDGIAAHIDIDFFRSRLRRCDRVETLDLDLFSEYPTADFGTGKLVGGVF